MRNLVLAATMAAFTIPSLALAASVTEIKKMDKVGGIQYYEVKCSNSDSEKISFDGGYWYSGYMAPSKRYPGEGANSGRNAKSLEEVAKDVCR